MIIFGEEYDATGIVFSTSHSSLDNLDLFTFSCRSLTEELSANHTNISNTNHIYSKNPKKIRNDNIIIDCDLNQIGFVERYPHRALFSSSRLKYFRGLLNETKIGLINIYLHATIVKEAYIILNNATEKEMFNMIKTTPAAKRYREAYQRLYICNYLCNDPSYKAIVDKWSGRSIIKEFEEQQILRPQQFEKYMELSGQSVIDLMLSSDQILRKSAKRYHQEKKLI